MTVNEDKAQRIARIFMQRPFQQTIAADPNMKYKIFEMLCEDEKVNDATAARAGKIIEKLRIPQT